MKTLTLAARPSASMTVNVDAPGLSGTQFNTRLLVGFGKA